MVDDERLAQYRQPTGTVERKGDVMQIQLAVPIEIKEDLKQLAENSEYSDWHYTRKTYHNTDVGEMILQDIVIPFVESGGDE